MDGYRGWAVIFVATIWGVFASPVSGDAALLTSEEVQDDARNYLIEQLGDLGYPVEIEVYYREQDLEIPSKQFHLEFEVAGRLKEMGRNQLTATVYVNNQRYRKFRVSTKTDAMLPVVHTSRSIQRGEIISHEDVEIERVRTQRPIRNVAISLEDVLGKEASRNLPAGRQIRMNSVKRPPLIEKGAHLLIVAQKGLMRITAPGTAREQGFKDSMIPVVNLQSKKIVYGRVLDANTVEVNF
ncbi:MAG: flagellar basal body P-ring formation protein FlgA [Candidatus Nitrohelix vancouverensis]|uniref:Flagella basal body P-ring formation protein FlgA n=1 Tax=Candidatus Nitrohelix vancouverensis TaxID=2705534 RepID=A0A7T0G2Q0_9BACT|nr:MAG: flagellar basal body P-ring formation protein FlgA [Candidatus Nitrohelix vancouverensis]